MFECEYSAKIGINQQICLMPNNISNSNMHSEWMPGVDSDWIKAQYKMHDNDIAYNIL